MSDTPSPELPELTRTLTAEYMEGIGADYKYNGSAILAEEYGDEHRWYVTWIVTFRDPADDTTWQYTRAEDKTEMGEVAWWYMYDRSLPDDAPLIECKRAAMRRTTVEQWYEVTAETLAAEDAEPVAEPPTTPPPAYVWFYQDHEDEDITGPYATEAAARADAEVEYIGNAYVDPSNAGTLSWLLLENARGRYVLQEDGKSVKVHLWRSEVLGAVQPVAEPPLITTADQLRALPVGTVLLDSPSPHRRLRQVWQVLADIEDVIYVMGGDAEALWLDDERQAATLTRSAVWPLVVLHTPTAATNA